MNFAEKNYNVLSDVLGKDQFISNKLNQLSRFGNDSIKKNSYAARAKEVVKTLPHEIVVKISKSAAEALNENNSSYPQLLPPSNFILKQNDDVNTNSNKIDNDTNTSRLVRILATIQLLSTESNQKKIEANAKSYNIYVDSIIEQSTVFAELLIKVLSDLKKLVGDANTGSEVNLNLEIDITILLTKFDEFKQYLDANYTSIASDLLTDYNELVGELASLAFSHSEGDLNKFETILHSFINKVCDILTRVVNGFEKYNKIDKFTYLMALIAELVDDDSKDQLEIAAELREKLSRAAASDAEKRAKEYADQIRKAEEMQKTMGCIGKILGWVVAALGFVAAVFTGGASLVVAGIALGVTVGDEIYQAKTGHSFIQDGLQLIMKPLMDFISKCFTDLLSDFGVKGEIKDLIGNILGAITTSVAFIAGMAVAGSVIAKAGSAVFQKLSEKVAEGIFEAESSATFSRLLSNSARKMITDMFDKFLGGIGRAAGLSEEKAAQIANYSQMGGVSLSILNSGLQVGGDISVNTMRLDAEKRRAEMQKDLAIEEVIKEMFDIAIEYYRRQIASVNSIIENMSTMAEDKYHADRFIVESVNSTFA